MGDNLWNAIRDFIQYLYPQMHLLISINNCGYLQLHLWIYGIAFMDIYEWFVEIHNFIYGDLKLYLWISTIGYPQLNCGILLWISTNMLDICIFIYQIVHIHNHWWLSTILLWISINDFSLSTNHLWVCTYHFPIVDIHECNYGYPQMNCRSP